MGRTSRATAFVGVADHAGWAVLVTVGRDAAVLDRRRVELVEPGVPVMPHHHDAQGLPEARAVALVERVRASATRCAAARLEELAAALPAKLAGLALRERPPLPPTVAERLRDHRAQNVADWVMYREALAGAAEARGWSVHWYDARAVLAEVPKAALDAPRAALGAPWRGDHRVAMAAALSAQRALGRRG